MVVHKKSNSRQLNISIPLLYSDKKLSYVKSLKKHLEDKNRTLFTRLELIEDVAKTVMTYTVSKFPYYTPHNFLHSQNVEEILNWVVPDDIKPKMSDYEIFFLIIAAWMHDWGMVGATNEDAEQIREIHHIRTEDFFEKLHDKVHLSLQEARIIGRICRGHRKEDLFSSRYENLFLGSNILIRVRFLAALIRVADECDTTASRTPEIVYYSIKPKGASDEEFRKHLLISGIGKQNPYKLVLSGVAKTPQGVQVIEGVKKKIQIQLNSVKSILGNYGVMLDTVDAQIDTRGFINKPIEFRLETESIVKLLIGNELYKRPDVAIREILSNSIDICRLQKVLSDNYDPCIEIIIDKDYIAFEDNGIGMNFEDAYEYFSQKGHSFYASKNFKDLLIDKEFDPISKFGIGLLSSFMIGRKMIVETKKVNCAPCKFIISDLAEGWIYEESSRHETGTKITLFLNSIGKDIDIESALQHYAKKVEIPIFIINNVTDEKRKLLQVWNYDIPEILEKISSDGKEKITKNKPISTLHADISGMEVTYYLFNDAMFSISEQCFLLKNGIYVGAFDFFPSVRGNWIALINCKSDLIDLKVSKEDIVFNDKYKTFLNTLYDNLLDTLTKDIHATICKDLSLDYCACFSRCFNNRFQDGFGIKRESYESLWLSKFYSKKIFPVIVKNGLVFMNISDIASNGFSKIQHYLIPEHYYAEHIEAVRKLFFSNMNEEEAVVIDFGPHFLFFKEDPRNFECALCEILRSNGIDSTECTNLSTIFSTYAFTQEHTPLDELLYKGSFFTKMPEIIQGITILVKPFEFNPPLTQSSKALFNIYYYENVTYQLYKEYPDIQRNFELRLLRRDKVVPELLSAGVFAYDMTDPFLDFLISKAQTILMNEPVKKLIEMYFRVLAINSISTIQLSYHQDATADVNTKLLERTIADLLGYSDKHIPIDKRMSKLAKVFFIEP